MDLTCGIEVLGNLPEHQYVEPICLGIAKKPLALRKPFRARHRLTGGLVWPYRQLRAEERKGASINPSWVFRAHEKRKASVSFFFNPCSFDFAWHIHVPPVSSKNQEFFELPQSFVSGEPASVKHAIFLIARPYSKHQ
jgi:hypothetical protein